MRPMENATIAERLDAFALLLELAEACDVPGRWACRTGVCHSCETTLIAGNLDYDPDPVEPPAAGSAGHGEPVWYETP